MTDETSDRLTATLHCPSKGYNWQRQMPLNRLSRVHFSINNSLPQEDWLFVYEGTSKAIRTRVPIQRRVFICGEPSSIRNYNKRFLQQFGTIWTTDSRIKHTGAELHHPCTPWHVGSNIEPRNGVTQMQVSDFKNFEPKKSKLISVIASNKTATPGHRKRLAFVEALKNEFGDSLDVYGRGIRDVTDKWQALADYKYHIAIENSSTLNYWTEKLADPILTLTYPIYYGCPNINTFFEDDAFDKIDISDVDSSIRTIRSAIENGKYESNLDKLRNARRQVLSEFNLFGEAERHVLLHANMGTERLKSNEVIWPEKYFDVFKRTTRRIRRLF